MVDPNQPAYQLYRKSTLGICLADALQDMVNNSKITKSMEEKVLLQFDKSISNALTTQVKTKVTFKGHLRTYNFCDNVWTFHLENTSFRTETETIHANRVKIVACDGKGDQKGVGQKKRDV
eukprot:TRINITY_DN7356_c0_g1_i1.p1 TRINITY_DN7356_c0_g1~~TRINITY_DN7356_c0_g1_i1.p1  ORF type:complete len:135 (-),score=41.08 TRINITY_DN7356_c0_g1_i1:373-735(-)